MNKNLTLSILSFCLSLISWSQKVNQDYQLHIDKTNEPIVLDGILDEKVWSTVDVADNFFMIQPSDGKPATQHSEARMCFDDNNIYMSIIFYNNEVKGAYNVESYKRDFSFNKNDNFIMAFDPFNNLTTGFTFGLNAYGAQWDGTLYDGARTDLNWDTKWVSEVRFDEDKWVCEIAIPFKSIRYNENAKSWGINFSRLDLKANEKSAWAPVPRQFPSISLAYSGNLVWDTPPPSQNKNISLIPYLATSVANSENDFQMGTDVKIGIGAALNLDLTINPDFSNTEVDAEVTNLNRFELFFPEKRQFFLENSDLFGNFGTRMVKPFFSRRIGLGVPITAGMRLSGNLGEDLRIGLMDIQTAEDITQGLAAENFGVLSLQQKVLDRSNIGMIFVNKQAMNFIEEQHTESDAFNRTLGLEFNYASNNNQWDGKLFYLKTFSDEKLDDSNVLMGSFGHQSKKWRFRVSTEYSGENVNAAVGFIPRTDYQMYNAFVGHTFWNENSDSQLVSHGPRVFSMFYYNKAGIKTDHFVRSAYGFNFLNRSQLEFNFDTQYVMLLDPFDPTQLGVKELAAGTQHQWNTVGVQFTSRPQSLMTYQFAAETGGYYNDGSKTEFSSELGYRFQPYVSINAIANYTKIELEAPWNDSSFWLLGAKADITFNSKLFFSNIYQYNQQFDRWGINSRLQWRYKPASDIFLVFNSMEDNGINGTKDWRLSLKINYWFNN
ncbi:MAG: carbohydrate binding family 9 domain-containing protein [Flavobacteriaceae bacterium]|nr:carbohydrate binding family 9 domain-containing protein [Flavobacteriaceae bacterium]